MSETIQIAERYCGPPTSGNGGYTCGMLARHTPYAIAEVTLRKPIPLNTPLHIEEGPDSFRLRQEENLIAEARAGQLDLVVPPSLTFAEAQTASRHYIAWQQQHAFPTCFVCGTARPEQDGLEIYAGKVDGQELYAAPWIPGQELGNEAGQVRSEFIWAALDCPGAYAAMGSQIKTIVLGRMTAHLLRPLRVGEQATVLAWLIGTEGRKSFSGTAIYNARKELCAKALATWFDL